ncbi:hypothetical protein BCR34DRAFT_391585 [Clohesyomyces aquaticus]|uniref:Uncharacterized protein n=1 Tax=Clohesyomyces aquaticus TaxID=1231657 RepID=A0A1Y1ZER9_9PLEO|nr:hypothetical protein BCR34DRAFT_391585 [Clohesyomyces aquaticus]
MPGIAQSHLGVIAEPCHDVPWKQPVSLEAVGCQAARRCPQHDPSSLPAILALDHFNLARLIYLVSCCLAVAAPDWECSFSLATAVLGPSEPLFNAPLLGPSAPRIQPAEPVTAWRSSVRVLEIGLRWHGPPSSLGGWWSIGAWTSALCWPSFWPVSH